MYECIDSNNYLYSVEQYCLLKKSNNHPTHIYCPFCNNRVYIRAENSDETTHFMHSAGTSCSSNDYSKLFNSTGFKKSKTELLALKFNILSFSYDIFTHIQTTFQITISTQEFISILKKIVNLKVIDLLYVTPEVIPYIWINEFGKYGNRLFLYTNKYNKKVNKLWNLSPTSKKNVVLCVDKNSDNKISRTIIPVDTTFLDNPSTNIPISFITSIIPEIFTSLKIDECYHDLLIKDLLSNV